MFEKSPPQGHRLVSIGARGCSLALVAALAACSGDLPSASSTSPSFTAWSVVSTSSSYTRTIPRFSEYNLQLKVTVSSAGESYIKPYNLAVAVTCGGC